MKTYKGSCHCGKVTYEVETALEGVISCNCSHCHKKGLIWNFVPKSQFKLLSGEENLTEYLFNRKMIRHLFCKDCGVQSFGYGRNKDGAETAALNVRALEGLDLESIQITPFNGKDF